MKVVMVDTMVFDHLVADDAARELVLSAIAGGRLVLRTTHIQEDQLAGITDEVKLAAVAAIPREVVLTTIAVWGVTKWDAGRWSDGDDNYEAIRHGSRHVHDAIIGATAAADADVLVTEDKRLRARATARQIPVWSVAELVAAAKA